MAQAPAPPPRVPVQQQETFTLAVVSMILGILTYVTCPSQTVLVREIPASPNGRRTIGYLDGHVESREYDSASNSALNLLE